MREVEIVFDIRVLLFGIRIKYWPLYLEVFWGRYEWVLLGKENKG
jgi:hypothetical protein